MSKEQIGLFDETGHLLFRVPEEEESDIPGVVKLVDRLAYFLKHVWAGKVTGLDMIDFAYFFSNKKKKSSRPKRQHLLFESTAVLVGQEMPIGYTLAEDFLEFCEAQVALFDRLPLLRFVKQLKASQLEAIFKAALTKMNHCCDPGQNWILPVETGRSDVSTFLWECPDCKSGVTRWIRAA